ncbi:MAG: alpha/beta hydrolase-fold protein [Polyangiaceae bacterium]|nr:alpha/beta hydrolase-fold protein [Polyangiaceae bacterium]
MSNARGDLELAPGPTGGLGALLVAGPLAAVASSRRAALSADFVLPRQVDLRGSQVRLGASTGSHPREKAIWRMSIGASGVLDLKADLATQGSEATALAFGVLRVTRPLRGWLLLGADDGVVAYLDEKQILSRDDSRAAHPDDDLIPLDLAPGDHPLLLKLHQRGGVWLLRLRITDEALAPARGVTLVLPGEIDADKVADELLRLDLDRRPTATGLDARLHLQVHGGWPRQTSREVTASARGASGSVLFSIRAGLFPLEEQGPAHDLTVRLPPMTMERLGSEGVITFEARVGASVRSFPAWPRTALATVLDRAAKLRKVAEEHPPFLKDPEATVATLDALTARIQHYAGRGDTDLPAQLEEAAALGLFLDSLEKKEDPFLAIRGARRVAYRSPLDGKPSTFALYVPPSFDPSKRYPLVVALHGMNGKPMNMLRWVFGRDDPGRDGEWEDRHPGDFPEYNAIVVAPMAHFNSFYRYAGEEDVIAVTEWVRRMFPVDPQKISITGPSMGGTGAAWVAFRYADRFAAAAPLCGYHSYFLRGDIAGKKLRPWERLQAEERSTVYWALNGMHLPLYIVHGTRDLPEENSGVLIERYKALGYPLLDEHPDEGHNVWQPTYEGLKGLRWLTAHTRPRSPARVAFRSNNLRYDRLDWVRLLRLERSLAWGEVIATRHKGKNPMVIEAKTSGVAALEFSEESGPLAPSERGPVRLKIDGDTVEFQREEPIRCERREGKWQRGVSELQGLRKRARLAGPLRDVHHEPTILVYGTSDPQLARANEEVARWFGAIRSGFDIEYPVVADSAFEPSMADGKALVLIGGPQSNVVTKALDERLPIHVTSNPPEIRLADRRHTGPGLGAAFVYPNPDQPTRYVVVIGGTDVEGTLRAMSMPDILPDYLIFDHRITPARGQLVLGRAELIEGGLFDESWQFSPTSPTP